MDPGGIQWDTGLPQINKVTNSIGQIRIINDITMSSLFFSFRTPLLQISGSAPAREQETKALPWYYGQHYRHQVSIKYYF